MSAGAIFTVILFKGNSMPEFFMADRTLSFDSFTAASGRPTIWQDGRPLEMKVSISTQYPSIPKKQQLYTFDSILPPLLAVL